MKKEKLPIVKEKSAGAIVFFKEKEPELLRKEPEFLLLHYTAGHWDYCKGHIEGKETEIETLKRELLEETGIKEFSLISGFREEMNYSFNRKTEQVNKTAVFYLIEVKSKEVKLSFEHKGFKWLEFEKASKQLTFDNAKNLLKKANEFLKMKKLA